uniref:Neurotransmitter-gated ion-channel ligand-binding domain-containing protein n=1 Tax=Glossina austeni TaxID=7395 RepID=A0A1A9VXF1_GLOAU
MYIFPPQLTYDMCPLALPLPLMLTLYSSHYNNKGKVRDIVALLWNSVLAGKSSNDLGHNLVSIHNKRNSTICLAGYNEKRLLHDLLDTYNTLERPVLNESDPLQLSFGLTLMQIIDVLLLKCFLWNILGGMSYKGR